MNLPFYVISCHAGYCPTYELCGAEGGKGTPVFNVDRSTNILNFTSGGEFCMFGDEKVNMLFNNKDDFRKMLLVDDRGDVIQKNRMRKSYPFVSIVNRASGADYPNFFCSFDGSGPEKDILGVFNLGESRSVSDITAANSLIKNHGTFVDGESHRWRFLNEIIQEVYSITGNNTGIFLIIGCSTPIVGVTTFDDLTKHISGPETVVQNLIRYADLEYNRIHPTLPYKRIKQINRKLAPGNTGSKLPLIQVGPEAMAGVLHETGENSRTMFPYEMKKDQADAATTQALLNTRFARGNM
jgi:hypothetical protein